MAYGTEAHQGFIAYNVVLDYAPSSTRIHFNITMTNTDGTQAQEATEDSLFQSILNKLVGITGTTLVSATKTGTFQTPVTSP